MEPLLRVSALGKRVEQRWLWRSLDFALLAGERLAVSGPSGAGKTLLLRLLAGLDVLEEGEIACLGRPQGAWEMPAYRAAVLYLHQAPADFEGTVTQALSLPFNLRVRRGAFPREEAIALLAAFGRPATFLTQAFATLSSGERQMVGLVRGLLLAPQVLLLDESTSAMDPVAAGQAEALVDTWLRANPARALVWVGHDAAQRARVTHRELSLGAG